MTPHAQLGIFLLDLPKLAGENKLTVGAPKPLDGGRGDSLVHMLRLTVMPAIKGGLDLAYGITLTPVENEGWPAIKIEPFGDHPDPDLRWALHGM